MGRTIPLLSLLFVAASRAGAQEVTLKSLLGEITDLEKLTRFPPSPPYASRQSSSYDRASTSPSDPSTWFANGDSGHYLRVEETANGRKEHVMLDAAGPGTVVRIWSANPDGTLRIYIDGAEKPGHLAEIPFVPHRLQRVKTIGLL